MPGAIAQFGEQGVIDTVGIVGYYTFLAMVMNTARTPLPGGAESDAASVTVMVGTFRLADVVVVGAVNHDREDRALGTAAPEQFPDPSASAMRVRFSQGAARTAGS